jgi:hypothetical protein
LLLAARQRQGDQASGSRVPVRLTQVAHASR